MMKNNWRGCHSEDEIGMVIAQARNGSDRYAIMFPGDPATYTPLIRDLICEQGRILRGWEQRGAERRAERRAARGHDGEKEEKL